jgi:hypothetical protein
MRIRRPALLLALAAGSVLVAGAGAAPHASANQTVTLLFGGDVMLGRGVARASAADPSGLLAGITFQVSSADLAAANLESPLTDRPHLSSLGTNALEARPAAARLLAAAGFDAMVVANNHAGDAGPHTVSDTVSALDHAGLAAVGDSYAPRMFRIHGLRVALLAFDATQEGPKGQVAEWDVVRARHAIEEARTQADVVAVGIQGGLEYRSATDPALLQMARVAGKWGADVVWGQGAHVVQPFRVLPSTHDGRPTVVATSLGNLVFDQHRPGTQRGAFLEVVAGADGVRAFRVGDIAAVAPTRFLGWRPPAGDAVALDGAWWGLARPVRVAAAGGLPSLAGFPGHVVSASVGDPMGNGGRQLAVAFRRRFRPENVTSLVPRSTLVDKHGLAAHLGLYRPGDLRPLWVAGTLFQPVARVAACDGVLAVAYSKLNEPGIVGTGAWRWGGFGFLPLPELAGRGVPACARVDGRLDAVSLERTRR